MTASGASGTVDLALSRSERFAAEFLESVPPFYAALLLLVADGLDDVEIAQRLDVDPQVIRPLIEVARRKLRRVVGEGDRYHSTS